MSVVGSDVGGSVEGGSVGGSVGEGSVTSGVTSVLGTAVVGSTVVGGTVVAEGTGVVGIGVGVLGLLVLVGRGVREGVRLGLGVEVGAGLAVRVFVPAIVAAGVSVGKTGSGSSDSLVGNKNEYHGLVVGVGAKVETALNVTAAMGLGVGVVAPVTGMAMIPTGLGIQSAIISRARAAAVLFISAKERPWGLRASRSVAEGGAGLKPATTKIIHAIPRQMPIEARACKGMAYFFIREWADYPEALSSSSGVGPGFPGDGRLFLGGHDLIWCDWLHKHKAPPEAQRHDYPTLE